MTCDLLLSVCFAILNTCLVPADPGVLEDVAHRRSVLFQQVPDWRDYEVLIAAPDCRLLGRSGWFIGEEGVVTAKVVDCAQPEHKADMVGWVDANVGERNRGWLILR